MTCCCVTKLYLREGGKEFIETTFLCGGIFYFVNYELTKMFEGIYQKYWVWGTFADVEMMIKFEFDGKVIGWNGLRLGLLGATSRNAFKVLIYAFETLMLGINISDCSRCINS